MESSRPHVIGPPLPILLRPSLRAMAQAPLRVAPCTMALPIQEGRFSQLLYPQSSERTRLQPQHLRSRDRPSSLPRMTRARLIVSQPGGAQGTPAYMQLVNSRLRTSVLELQ